jgi:hypothetical protein
MNGYYMDIRDALFACAVGIRYWPEDPPAGYQDGFLVDEVYDELAP